MTGVLSVDDRPPESRSTRLRSVGIMTHEATRPSEPAPSNARLGTGFAGILIRIMVAVAILAAGNIVPAAIPAIVMLVPGSADALSGGMSPVGFVLTELMQLLTLAVVVLAVWGWMRWIERSPIRAAGWRWSHRSAWWLLIGVVASACTVVAVTWLLPSVGDVRGAAELGVTELTPLIAVMLVFYSLGLGFVQQGIPEELLFRGWLAWRLRDRPVVAVAVTTAAFTVIHLVSQGGQENTWQHVLYLAQPLGFALLASGMMLWTGSLWAAVGVHGGFHLGTQLSFAFLPVTDAVTSWLAIGGVQAAVGLVLVTTALRRGRTILAGRD